MIDFEMNLLTSFSLILYVMTSAVDLDEQNPYCLSLVFFSDEVIDNLLVDSLKNVDDSKEVHGKIFRLDCHS